MASFVSCTNGKGSQRNGNPKDLRNRIGSERDWTCDGLVYCLLNNSILLISVRWCDPPSPGRVSSEFRDCIDYERYLLRDERYWKPWTNTANKSIKFASPPKCKYKKWFYGAGWCQAPGFSGGGLGLMRQTQQAVLLVTLLIKGTDC